MNDALPHVVDIAHAAGREILEVYAGEFEVAVKGDGSPLTQADRRAHDLIEQRLRALAPSLPVLSEESGAQAFAARRRWRRYWLVDPLDGTREFVKRSGEFTVNIALIEDGRPRIGVVYAPVKGVSFYAAAGAQAFKHAGGAAAPIRVKKFNREKAVMATSRSHTSKAVDAYRARLAAEVEQVEITAMGSSLKICLVAEGRADIYPRLAPTSEWDTAAAHCILEAAGGNLTNIKGNPLTYNKPSLLNPWFLATGDPDFNWTALAAGIE